MGNSPPTGIATLGRVVENDLVIDHPSVSSRHCEFMVMDSGVTVKDLNSSNGTFIDGQAVSESVLLPGQALQLGDVRLQLERTATPPPRSPAMPTASFTAAIRRVFSAPNATEPLRGLRQHAPCRRREQTFLPHLRGGMFAADTGGGGECGGSAVQPPDYRGFQISAEGRRHDFDRGGHGFLSRVERRADV